MDKQAETSVHKVVYKPTTDGLSMSLKAQEKITNLFSYIAAATASLMALTAGMSFGWSSPVLPKLMMNNTENPLGRPISHNEESWIAGVICLGGMLGPLAAGTMADKLGRKKTLLSLAIPMAISMTVIAFAKTVLLYLILRFILGVGVGSIFTVLPMYLGEIAEDHNRGILGCFMGVFIAVGLLVAFVIGPYLSVKMLTLVSTIPLAIFIVIFSFWIPESPQFLASVNKLDKLEKSLMQLRKKSLPKVQQEALEILKVVQKEQTQKGGFGDLVKTRSLRKGLIISIGLILLQQIAGINAVLSYMQNIFAATGSSIAPEISTMIIGAVQVVVSIFTSSVVEKLGRKILLLISLIGCCISLVALGGYFYFKANGYNVDAVFWLPVLSLLIYIITFNIGLGPLPWAIIGELFPSSVKSAASTLTSFSCFFGAFAVALIFPIMSLALGMAGSFWIFAIGCVFGAVFIYWILPETKGKSLQEIQRLLER